MADQAESASVSKPLTKREIVLKWSDANTDDERKAIIKAHPEIKDILSAFHWSHLD